MKTAIVSDSNCGMNEREATDLGIHLIPMPVVINQHSYFEGKDLDYLDFLQYLIDGEKVTTSQPSPADLMMTWEMLLQKGYDEIIYIPMSSGLSSSFQTANMIAQDYPGKVYVVDAHRISVTQRHAVLDALALLKEGLSAVEIRTILEENAYQSFSFVGVDDIGFLKRGGRITPSAAMIASVLNIKPLLQIRGEKIDSYEKIRGTRKCQKELLKVMQEKSSEFEGRRCRIDVAGSFLEWKDAEIWLEMARKAFPDYTIQYYPLTCSISCHTGPNAFGMGISVCLSDQNI